MINKPYTISDFSIGESVVPVNQKQITLVVVDIDRKHKKIICRLSQDVERLQHEFEPTELEKEPYIRPPNIVGLKSSHQGNLGR